MKRRPQFSVALAALLALACAFPPAARAQSPSTPPGTSESAAKERAALFAELAAAKSEPEARQIEERIWNFWFRAPDAESQRLLDLSKYAQLKFDYGNAFARLDELIKHAPDYAEGWNQRATLLFLTGSYELSLEAIVETLKREPLHYGALAGRGIILLLLGRDDEGQVALKEALKINPWLKERGLISDKPGRKI
jgi:tetratricopeptide (TPR) repeat protein